MILTLTPNPAWDVTYQVPELVPDSSHRITEYRKQAGGKGINVARVAATAGFSVCALAPCNELDGELFAADLRSSGVQFVPVLTESAVRVSTTVVEPNGRATVFNESGSAQPAQLWAALAEQVGVRIDGASVLVGSGSLPQGAPADLYAGMAAIAADAGVLSIIDTSGPGLLSAAAAGADWLKPNRPELLEATGETEVRAGVENLVRSGARNILLSDGEAGLRLFAATGELVTAKLPTPVLGNPTGAGDAVVAALATLLGANPATPLAQLGRRAAAWGAAAVLEPVAGRISEQWQDLEEQVQVQEEKWA